MRCPGKGGKLGFLLFSVIGALIFEQPAHLLGQKVVSARAGLITFIQGSASVDDRPVVLKTARFEQMKDGETLATGRGRVELLLAPGVFLRLPENSQVRMDDTQLADTHLTLLRGDALIEIVQLADGVRIQVAVAETATELARPGLYRFGIAQNGTQNSIHNSTRSTLRVYGGEAMVRVGSRAAQGKRGMEVDLDPDLGVDKFDRKQVDALHIWAARRSFELFMTDPEARQRQTHWESSGAGYVENRNFGVKVRAILRRRPPPPPVFGPGTAPIEER